MYVYDLNVYSLQFHLFIWHDILKHGNVFTWKMDFYEAGSEIFRTCSSRQCVSGIVQYVYLEACQKQ